jgi:hypothetical protein
MDRMILHYLWDAYMDTPAHTPRRVRHLLVFFCFNLKNRHSTGQQKHERSASYPVNRVKTKTCKKCTLNTIHYGGNIHHFFYIFGYLQFFNKYMKNKIGILENDKYIYISHSE